MKGINYGTETGTEGQKGENVRENIELLNDVVTSAGAWCCGTNALVGAVNGFFRSEEKSFLGHYRFGFWPPTTGKKRPCWTVISMNLCTNVVSVGEFRPTSQAAFVTDIKSKDTWS